MIGVFFAAALGLAGSQPEDLTAWAGRTPGTAPPGANGGMLDDPRVASHLLQILAPGDRALLRSYSAIASPDLIEGFLVISRCKPHDCPSSNATVIASADGRRLWVAFFERRGEVWSTRWLGDADYVSLPPAVQAEVRWGHEPKP